MEQSKLKIYLADTEDNALSDYFKNSEKFSVVGKSTDGVEVARDVKLLKPDFLIMEVMLSGMDGFMVMENLKKEMKEKMPKIIFISNLSHSGFVSKAIKEGASYFMVKPVLPENLEQRLKDLMQAMGIEP